MKKRIGMFLAAAMAAVGAWADTWTDPDTGYTWTYRINGDTARINGVALSTGAVTIPSTLGGMPVTSIGEGAFSGSGVTSCTVPATVTDFGPYAFSECSQLESLTVLTHCCVNDSEAQGIYLSDCPKLKTLTLPDYVTDKDGKTAPEWGSWTLGIKNLPALESLIVPENITSCVFMNCQKLSAVRFPSTLRSMPEGLDGFVMGGLWSLDKAVFAGSVPVDCLTTGEGRCLHNSIYDFLCYANSVYYPAEYAEQWKKILRNFGYGGTHGVYAPSASAAMAAMVREAPKYANGTTPDFGPFVVGISAEQTMAGAAGCDMCGVPAGLTWNSLSGTLSGAASESGTFTVVVSNGRVSQNMSVRVDPGVEGLAPEPVDPEPTPTPGPRYQMLNAEDITEPYSAPKAVTLSGVMDNGQEVMGIVELKLGKVNAKKKTSKVSGSVTTLDGKKHTAKGVTVAGIDGTAPAVVSLEVKDLGTMAVTIGGDRFAGSLGGTYHVQSADVGGAWAGGTAVAAVETGDLTVFAGTVLSGFLPTNEVAAVSGGKWSFKKAASVKWAKPKKGAEHSKFYDEASGKDLIIDTTKDKTNLSGLKLTYTPKKGTFKGSFNVYVLEGEGKATKLKKHKVNVTGVVVGGVGYGVATCKKPAVAWPVVIR